jgi:hypothetical protein
MGKTLKGLEDAVEESKEGLLGTIKVPRNLGQITDRLPKANYDDRKMKRISSEPGRIGAIV